MSEQITGWVPVETMDIAGRVRADHGALHLDGLSWAYLDAAQWEALKVTGDRLMAGIRGRKVLELASEAGGTALLMLAGDVEDCLTEPWSLDEMTDADWLRVARVLDRPDAPRKVLWALWEQAGNALTEPPVPLSMALVPAVRTVTIPAGEQHEGLHSMRVTLPWTCPQCGGPRGEPFETTSYDGSRRLGCDGWKNPCGHVDGYAAVRQEARALAESEASRG
jgi:hypothetical protein